MRESRINVFKTAQETIRKRAAVARMIEAGPDDPDEGGDDFTTLLHSLEPPNYYPFAPINPPLSSY